MTLEIYPDNCSDEKDDPAYIAEFIEDGDDKYWTLYRRAFIFTEEEWAKIKSIGGDSPLMNREGHGYNLFRSKLLPDGCVPDKKWICWMVDALNEKARIEKQATFDAKVEEIKKTDPEFYNAACSAAIDAYDKSGTFIQEIKKHKSFN